ETPLRKKIAAKAEHRRAVRHSDGAGVSDDRRPHLPVERQDRACQCQWPCRALPPRSGRQHGRIRIGVREYYPQFGVISGNERHGYEIDVARAIAGRLGIAIDFEKVKAATRIPMLANDQVDLTIATMGHNAERNGQVRFIRPHYYRSETTIVGPRDLVVASWADLAGKTVCATVGNGSKCSTRPARRASDAVR